MLVTAILTFVLAVGCLLAYSLVRLRTTPPPISANKRIEEMTDLERARHLRRCYDLAWSTCRDLALLSENPTPVVVSLFRSCFHFNVSYCIVLLRLTLRPGAVALSNLQDELASLCAMREQLAGNLEFSAASM